MLSLPDVFSLVWEDFLMLNSARTSSGFGLNALQYSEIKSYYELIQHQPEPWEIEVIRLFDSTALQVFAESQKSNQNKTTKS